MKKHSFPTDEEIINIKKFVKRKKNKNIKSLRRDALAWMITAWRNKMDYEVNWLGIPIIQNPYDMILMQELIFDLKPDVIIETGVAHGGSLIYYSSLLELLKKGRIVGIDIDIRDHNRKLLEKHPLIKRVTMIEGSSVDRKVIAQIKRIIKPNDKVIVVLDSNHKKQHVYEELSLYKDIVSKGSFIVVFDTFMPYLEGLRGLSLFKNNSPMDAVRDFIRENPSFIIDRSYNKFFVSSCPDGFIKKLR